MRLRRLEFVVIGVTLAFACFIGGFYTGRSWSNVNIIAVEAQNEGNSGAGVTITQVQPEAPATVETGSSTVAGGQVTTAEAVPVDVSTGEIGDTATGVPGGIPGGEPRAGDGKININLATQSELTDLPGIGNVLASRIVDYRTQHGAYAKIEDVKNVSGIGAKRFEAIQDKITVG